MCTAIETARLVRLQAQALLRFLERKGLVLSRGDPVKEIWADVAAFADGTRDLSGLTQIWQRNSMSARDATCVGVNHECVNAAVFLVRVHGVRHRDGSGRGRRAHCRSTPPASADDQPVGTATGDPVRGSRLGGAVLAMKACTALCMKSQRSTPWRRQVS